MSRPISPSDILCKDGKGFSVALAGGTITVFATFRDDLRSSSGLARFTTFHEPGDPCAEHTGMPVEVVRAYARAHGGVAEAGAEALALLKSLPSQADPPIGAPVTDSQPAAVEAAPERPLPDARGAAEAGRSPASAAPRASDPARAVPAVVLDDLTPAVIAARREVAAGSTCPPWNSSMGTIHGDCPAETASRLWRLLAVGSAISRIRIAARSRYDGHPLRAEAFKLWAELQAIANELGGPKRS